MSTETTSPIRISKTRELTLPLALLCAMIAAAAVGYARWSSTEEKVNRAAADIIDIKAEAKTTREILIRIDENVKEIRRTNHREDRGNP